MDPNDCRRTQDANGAGGDTTMESGDWRTQLQRQTIVSKIMDILKMHLPFSRHQRVQELKKIAERVEEEIFTAATNQSEYARKICFMMLSMDTRLQMHKLDTMGSNSGVLYNNVNPLVPLDSTALTGFQNGGSWQDEVYHKIKVMKELYQLDLTSQFGNPNGEDWQEEVYQKIKAMKDLYLQELNDIYQKIVSKLQQHDSLPQQPKTEQFEKLKIFKNMLERFMQFLQIPKHEILANHKDKLGTYEKHIINVISLNRRKHAPPQQQAQALPPPHMQSLQQSEEAHS